MVAKLERIESEPTVLASLGHGCFVASIALIGTEIIAWYLKILFVSIHGNVAGFCCSAP